LYLSTLGIAYAEAQQLDEAVRCFKRALKERPTAADTHYNLGKTYVKLGELHEAERCYLRARQLAPGRVEIANNLTALLSYQGRYQEALVVIGEQSALSPDNEALVLNSAAAALATSGPDTAIRHLSEYLRRHPDSVAAREERALLLLAGRKYAEGWREYASRRVRPAVPRRSNLRGHRVLLLSEQGLGDHLFFLRFAPRLREHAASVAFDCPAKLFPLLEGNATVEVLRSGTYPRSNFDVELPLGDIPEALEDWSTPPAFTIAPRRCSHWRERLAAIGPAPYLGVTWRAGTNPGHKVEFAGGPDALYKQIGIEALAAALREWQGTVLVLQRLPLLGEVETFSRALGRRAHDLSALNEDLEDIAAVLELIDEYVGVSNTNMHIRAGLEKTARVLVPFPPEFRWMHTGRESPWFPGFRLYRQDPARAWTVALETLREDLSN
jgi:Tfp pilus assembly protein PilF